MHRILSASLKRFLGLSLLAAAALAFAGDPSSVPDPARTPGALNPDITQETFHQRICVEGAAQYRPAASYTNGLKRKQIRDFGYDNQNPADYEEDHLIPLSLGGHPRSPKNLWPQPRRAEWGADRKDQLEFALYKAACKGEISLADAQAAFTHDWTASYQRYKPLIRKYKFKGEGEGGGEEGHRSQHHRHSSHRAWSIGQIERSWGQGRLWHTGY